MATSASIVGGERYVERVLRDTPVGYWRLGGASGNALDSSGNGRTLTAVGTSMTYGVSGALADGDPGVSFPGGNTDRFWIADAALLPTVAVTLEFWFNPSDVTRNPQYLVGVANGSNRGYFVEATLTAVLGRVGNGTTKVDAAKSGALTVGVWTHIVLTHDGSNVRLYCDGLLCYTAAFASAIGYGTGTKFVVGQLEAWDANRQATGVLDEVAVYDYVLTARQIAEHYALASASSRGGLQVGGSAAVLQHRGVIGSGGLTIGGAATLRQHRGVVGSGGLAIGGAATVQQHRGVVGTGGLLIGGDGNPVGRNPVFIDVAGSYQPVIDIVGTYQPVIDVVGSV